jgi:hypothetical protein
MELIDRYVAEVARQLPPKQRADIQAELRSSLVDNLEARSEDQPTQEQVINLLQEFGPPQKLAASYWPEGQYLIGPTLYPIFRMVAGIALLVTVIVQVVLLAIALIFQPEILPIQGFFDDFVPTIVSAFGWTVLAFAIMQRLNVRLRTREEHWDPLSLPPVEDSIAFSQAGIVAEIALELILIVLLILLPYQLPQMLPTSIKLYINPIMVKYMPLIVLSIVLGVGLNVILLWRGKWETGTRLAKIMLNTYGIAVLALLINNHNLWLVEHNATGFLTVIRSISQANLSNDTAAQILAMQVYRMVFIIALVAIVADTARIGWSLIKNLVNRTGTPTIPFPDTTSNG